MGVPFVSLSLLFITYGVFGWYWSGEVIVDRNLDPWREVLWSTLVFFSILIAALMTGPLHFLRSWILKWFKSDLRSFATIVTVSFLAVLLLVQIAIVANTMLLLSAMFLARLDLQTHQFGEWQAFWILALLSLTGLGAGGVGYWLLYTGFV